MEAQFASPSLYHPHAAISVFMSAFGKITASYFIPKSCGNEVRFTFVLKMGICGKRYLKK
jgi:hypothetical protein